MNLPSNQLTDFNYIREWLLNLLEEKSMSVEELANRVGVTRAAIYLYLRDKARPTEQTMTRICRELGVPPEDGLKRYTHKQIGRPSSLQIRKNY